MWPYWGETQLLLIQVEEYWKDDSEYLEPLPDFQQNLGWKFYQEDEDEVLFQVLLKDEDVKNSTFMQVEEWRLKVATSATDEERGF